MNGLRVFTKSLLTTLAIAVPLFLGYVNYRNADRAIAGADPRVRTELQARANREVWESLAIGAGFSAVLLLIAFAVPKVAADEPARHDISSVPQPRRADCPLCARHCVLYSKWFTTSDQTGEEAIIEFGPMCRECANRRGFRGHKA